MFAAAFAILVIGYAAAYSGASNLFTGGKGWGFMQAMLGPNKGKNSSMAGMAALIQPVDNSPTATPPATATTPVINT